jgi:moderate conductance mechanosensitive channel
LRITRTILAAIVWFGIALWVVAALIVLSLFPSTTPLAVNLIERIVTVAAIWLIAALIDRIADVVIQRFFLVWSKAGPAQDVTRRTLRTPTIVAAVGGFKSLVIYFVAALLTLSEIGFSSFSVLAVGGIAAVALGLAAQNLVLDFVNGFFVLTEDQYAVGDYVAIGTYQGLVESMSLRILKVRNDEGSLVTIPHGLARIVVNQTRDWSRVDYRIAVGAGTDADEALELLRSTIEEMAAEPEWRDAITAIEFSGVQSFSRMGMVLRARVKTAPGEQWRVSRELHRRVGRALQAAGIELGVDLTGPVAAMMPE